MTQKFSLRWIATALLAVGAIVTVAVPATAQEEGCPDGNCRSGFHFSRPCGSGFPGCRDYGYGNPDLFYNFYANPVCGGTGATLYVSPGPVPAHVGHTYITYQPLMPHEFLYKHDRTYHRYYDEGRGLTRTHIKYYSPPVRTGVHGLANMVKIAR